MRWKDSFYMNSVLMQKDKLIKFSKVFKEDDDVWVLNCGTFMFLIKAENVKNFWFFESLI